MLTKNHLTKIQENLLIQGATGSGKSHLARWVHENSDRSHLQFFHVNIASLSKGLFESELFGHKKGSFTGAISDKLGFCERVGSGTLFIDEIGELSLEQQKALLTLLEEKIFYQVGSEIVKKFKGVFFFATNKDLNIEVQKGKFREDLYHRLRSFTYNIEDFSARTDKGVKIYEEFHSSKLKHEKNDLRLSKELVNFLKNYSFPGNYRELRQITDYLCFVGSGDLQITDLPSWVKDTNVKERQTDSYYQAFEKFEKRFLEQKLKKFQGRINFTAQTVEISKVTLISKIRKYGINVAEYKINNFERLSSYGI